MKVVWKDIKGYEGIYQISNFGEVIRLRSYDSRNHLRNSKILKQRTTSDGYLQLGLHKNGKETKYLVHRLVAEAFLPNPDNLTEVNHIDENKQNNCISNLEWCTHKYNTNYGTCQERRLTAWKQKREEKLCVEKNY